MAEFTIEKVCQAIQSFKQGDVKQSDEYLKSFAQSQYAWTITIQILQQQPDQIIAFHSLRILKSKIIFDINSLSAQNISELYTNCLQIINIYGRSKDKPQRVQCALMLIYLYVYTYNENSQTILDILIKTLQCLNEESGLVRFVYEVLEAMPEELVDNTNIVMDENQLKRINEAIKQSQMAQILDFLQSQWCQQNNTNIQFHILRTYKKWLVFMKYYISEQEAIQFLQFSISSTLFQGALNAITHEELQDKAVEAMCQFMRLVPKSISQNNQLEQVGTEFFKQAFNTFSICQKVLQDDLSDEINAYTKFYVKLGKKFVHPLLMNNQLDQFVDIMLQILNHSNSNDSVEGLCDFFMKFIRTIKQLQDQTLVNKWSPQFQLLIQACIQKSRIDIKLVDDDEDDATEEQELKIKNRSSIKHVVQELVQIIQPNVKHYNIIQQQVIKQLGSMIQIYIIGKATQLQDWIGYEAVLYLVNGTIEYIIQQKDEIAVQYILEMLNVYFNLYKNNEKARELFILKTIYKAISFPIVQAIHNQEMVEQLFNFIYEGINSEFKKAAKAFQMICCHKSEFVLNNIDKFIGLLQVKDILSTNYEYIVKGVANAICQSKESIQKYYVTICAHYGKGLQQQLQNISDQNTINVVLKNISCLIQIISQAPTNDLDDYLIVRQIICGVYIELWPIFKKCLELFSVQSPDITEKIVKYTKHTFRACLNTFSVELLTQVFQCLLLVYQEAPISSCIYAAEVSATVFYKYQEYRFVLMNAFENMCQITFRHLPKLESFEDNPELTEDLFGMLVRYGRYTPTLLLSSSALPTIIQLTMMAIGLKHVVAAKSFYAWLEVLFKMLKQEDEVFRTQIPSEFKEKLQQNLINYIPQYLSKLFQCLREGQSDKEVEDYIVDCVLAISELNFINFPQLLAAVLDEGPQNLLTQFEKTQWIENCRDKEKQQEYLELFTKRSYHNLVRC